MTKEYIEKLIKLAKEIHEMQLEATERELSSNLIIKSSSENIRLNGEINYLIGYIMALEHTLEVLKENEKPTK